MKNDEECIDVSLIFTYPEFRYSYTSRKENESTVVELELQDERAVIEKECVDYGINVYTIKDGSMYCLYTGRLLAEGIPSFSDDGRTFRFERIAQNCIVGPISRGRVIDPFSLSILFEVVYENALRKSEYADKLLVLYHDAINLDLQIDYFCFKRVLEDVLLKNRMKNGGVDVNNFIHAILNRRFNKIPDFGLPMALNFGQIGYQRKIGDEVTSIINQVPEPLHYKKWLFGVTIVIIVASFVINFIPIF